MKKRVIEVADFQDYIIRQEIAGHYSKYAHKSLLCAVKPSENKVWYEVKHKRSVYYITSDVVRAFEKYNELP